MAKSFTTLQKALTDVPFLDLRAATRSFKLGSRRAALRVMRNGWYLLGSELQAFELRFTDYLEVVHWWVGVSNGLDAVHLKSVHAGIRPGDGVVVPSNISGCVPFVRRTGE